MKTRLNVVQARRWMAGAGLLAGPLFAVSLLVFAASLPGYHHADHPPALLGARGYAGSEAWNVVGFELVGLLSALAVEALYRALRDHGARWMARIGVVLMLVSAIAFIGQGLVPLDIRQSIEAPSNRHHIAIWNVWWQSAATGMLVAGIGLRHLRAWRTLAWLGLATASLTAAMSMSDFGGVPDGWRQRITLVAWFGWLAWASCLVLTQAAPPRSAVTQLQRQDRPAEQ